MTGGLASQQGGGDIKHGHADFSVEYKYHKPDIRCVKKVSMHILVYYKNGALVKKIQINYCNLLDMGNLTQ